ncbi:MAG: hypothetical protein L3J84_07020 [Gammaproteobacteria bacterium]|nr:hypothetical protein [Gammaproteobacteria bacterium]
MGEILSIQAGLCRIESHIVMLITSPASKKTRKPNAGKNNNESMSKIQVIFIRQKTHWKNQRRIGTDR